MQNALALLCPDSPSRLNVIYLSKGSRLLHVHVTEVGP